MVKVNMESGNMKMIFLIISLKKLYFFLYVIF